MLLYFARGRSNFGDAYCLIILIIKKQMRAEVTSVHLWAAPPTFLWLLENGMSSTWEKETFTADLSAAVVTLVDLYAAVVTLADLSAAVVTLVDLSAAVVTLADLPDFYF